MEREDILSEIKKTELAMRRSLRGGLAGSYASVYRGNGMELAALREYTESDDFRMIDWNATAKTGKPFTRVMQEERGLELYLLVDISASMACGGSINPPRKTKLEAAAVTAAILGFSAISGRDKTAAILFSGRVEETILPAAGRRHAFAIAERILDSSPLSSGSDLESACASLPSGFRKKGICAIISDMEYNLPWQAISKLSSRAEPALLHITDPFDRETSLRYSFEGFDADPAPAPAESQHALSDKQRKKPAGFSRKGNERSAPVFIRGRGFAGTRMPGRGEETPCRISSDSAGSKAARLGIPYVEISTDDNIAEKINIFFKLLKR